MNGDLDPGIGLFLAEPPHTRRRGLPVLQKDPALQILDIPVLQHSLDLHEVCLRQFMPGMGHEVGEIAVIGQEEQPLGVVIEAADGIDAGPDALQEV
jgi:hypothetical protein